MNCFLWDANPVILPIAGPFQLRWYGLAFLGVFYFGYKLQDWQMRRGGHPEDTASRFLNWGVVGLLAGAWFVHRIFYEPERIMENPLYLIDVTKGLAGLSSHGGALGLIAALYFFGRANKISFIELIDRVTWSAAAAAVFVRAGNFFNSEIVGRPTDVPWAVCFPRFDTAQGLPLTPRHPTQIYEVLIGVGILGLLTWVDRKAGKEKRPRYLITGVFMISFFAARFFVEFFKRHQALDSSSAVTMGQLLSLPFIAFGCWCLWMAHSRRLPASSALPVEAAAPVRKKGKKKGKK